MYSIFSPSSYLPLIPPFGRLKPHLHVPLHYHCFGSCYSDGHKKFPLVLFCTVRNLRSSVSATGPAIEGIVPIMNFEDLMEKDWSFLESDDTDSDEQHNQATDQIISAAEIGETSRVLISIGSEGFVDRLINSSPCEQLLIVHDSLLTLACIKEKHDNVKCWQGELISLPEKWSPFDVIFLYFLPALPFQLGQVLGALAKHCLPGARIVISHPQGRGVAEKQQKQHPDIVVSELPDKTMLQAVAADYPFTLVKFVDEPEFYVAVLKLKEG